MLQPDGKFLGFQFQLQLMILATVTWENTLRWSLWAEGEPGQPQGLEQPLHLEWDAPSMLGQVQMCPRSPKGMAILHCLLRAISHGQP